MTDLLPNDPLRSGPAGAVQDDRGGEHDVGVADAGTRTRIVLDTSVMIADPGCLTGFGDVDVVVPLTVVEELDSLKTRPDDVGRSARTALRTLEDLRTRHGGSLARPVPVGEAGGTIRIEINGENGTAIMQPTRKTM